MAFSQQLLTVLDSNDVPLPFKDWLQRNSVLTVSKYVLAARGSLEHVEEELIRGCGLNLSIGEKIAVRQSWVVAEQINRKEATAAAAADAAPDSAPLSVIDSNNLQLACENEYHFRIPAKRLLDDALLGRILRELRANPKRLRFIPAEQLRLSTSSALPVGSTLTMLNGALATNDIMGPEDPRDGIELFRRIRALMNSLTLVTIDTPDWLPYMVGDQFADKCLDWMNATYNGQRHPLGFFKQAYACTFQYFITEIRDHDIPLARLIDNEAAYRSFWTNFVPPPTTPAMAPPRSPPPSVRSGNVGQPDPSTVVTRELANIRSTTDRMNMRFDRLEAGGGNNQQPVNRRNDRQPLHRGGARLNSNQGTTSIKGGKADGRGGSGRGGGGGGGVQRDNGRRQQRDDDRRGRR